MTNFENLEEVEVHDLVHVAVNEDVKNGSFKK